MAKMPSKPKKPKQSASLASWEKYDQKVKDWHKKCNEIKNAKNKKASLIKKHT